MTKQTYKVMREHQGDKDYVAGDTRTADPSDVQHLVDLGVLKPVKAKADNAEKTKVDNGAKNKAAK